MKTKTLGLLNRRNAVSVAGAMLAVASSTSPALAAIQWQTMAAPVTMSSDQAQKPNALAGFQQKNQALQSGDVLQVALSLKIGEPQRLEAFIQEQAHAGSPGYGRTLSAAEYREHFAPSQAKREQVADYLRRHGFTGVEVSEDGMMVTATGSVATIESAFNTRLASWKMDDGGRAVGHTTELQLPTDIASSVEGILGLDEIHRMQPVPHSHSKSVPQPRKPGAVDRQASNEVNSSGAPAASNASISTIDVYEFPGLYEADRLPVAYNTTVGVLTVGSDQTVVQPVLSNLDYFASYFGYSKPNISQVEGVPGKTAYPDNNGDALGVLEFSGDTQAILGMAGGQLGGMVLYKSPTYNYDDMSRTMATAVSDGRAKIINISIQGCYTDAGSQAMRTTRNALLEAKARGITFSAASGDYGSNVCGGQHRDHPAQQSFSLRLSAETQSWPASEANLMAIGGTEVYQYNDGSYAKETAWNNLLVNGQDATTGSAGGGGESRYVNKPDYQVGIVPGSGRGVPDISFDGSCRSGAIVYNYGWRTFCGTSLASPLFAGLYARLQTAFDNQLGLPNSMFYKMFSNSPSLVRDVTEGNIGAYSATPGWDYATGFGSIRGQAVYNYINQYGAF